MIIINYERQHMLLKLTSMLDHMTCRDKFSKGQKSQMF